MSDALAESLQRALGDAYRVDRELGGGGMSEEMGRKADAIAFARIFLATFDRAGPVGTGRIKEARDRLARLGGSDKGLPVRTVKR